MRRWLILLLVAALTTGCAAAQGMSAPGGGGSFFGGGPSRKVQKPLEARLGSGDTVARLLVDGDEILPALLDSIRQARQRLDVEMYEFGNPRLQQAIVDRARHGVPVRVILDATEKQSQAMAQALQATKVNVRIMAVSGGIDHVKLLVADNVVVIGGMNWGQGSMLNHDYDVLLRKAPAEFGALFERDWAVAGGGNGATPDSTLLLYDSTIRPAILQYLTEAHTAIWLEMDELTDVDVIDALRTARSRGLDVRVLLDPRVEANHKTASTLINSGLSVKWWVVDHGMLHAKAMLIDKQHMIVGSANLTQRGLGVNHEAGVDLQVPELANRLGAIFDTDWQRSTSARA